MRKEAVEQMERQELAYNLLLSKIILFKEKLEKVTLYRKKNSYGRLTASIVCYLEDRRFGLHTEKITLYDDEYLWFMCALQQDFPEVELIDLNAEEEKDAV